MKISIKTLKNKKYPLEVSESDTILNVKNKISEELKLGEPSSQKLIFSGKILKDDQTLAAAKVKENDFLVIMVSKAKRKPAQPKAAATPAPQPASTQPAANDAQPAPAPAPAPAPNASQPAAPEAASNNSDNAAQGNNQGASDPSSNLVVGAQYEEMVANLTGMGFPREQVVVALRASFNNPDRAVQYLTEGIPPEMMAAHSQAPPANPGNQQAAPDADGDGPEAAQGAIPQDPRQIAALLQHMAQTNPQLLQALGLNNPEVLRKLLQDPQALAALGQAASQMGAQGRGGPGPEQHVIQVTPEERAAIDRLASLGFSRERALEAYLLCDKNEELAANYLFDNSFD